MLNKLNIKYYIFKITTIRILNIKKSFVSTRMNFFRAGEDAEYIQMRDRYGEE